MHFNQVAWESLLGVQLCSRRWEANVIKTSALSSLRPVSAQWGKWIRNIMWQGHRGAALGRTKGAFPPGRHTPPRKAVPWVSPGALVFAQCPWNHMHLDRFTDLRLKRPAPDLAFYFPSASFIDCYYLWSFFSLPHILPFSLRFPVSLLFFLTLTQGYFSHCFPGKGGRNYTSS